MCVLVGGAVPVLLMCWWLICRLAVDFWLLWLLPFRFALGGLVISRVFGVPACFGFGFVWLVVSCLAGFDVV